VDGTGLTFCPVTSDNKIDCNSPDRTFAKIPDTEKGASFAYKITLKAGKWVLFADKDVDGDGKILGNGDYTGCHGEDVQKQTCLIFQPPKAGVDVQMRIMGGGNPPPPPPPGPPPPPPPPGPPGPPPPPGGGDVRGTITAPPGKTVDGVLLTFCPVDNTNTIKCSSPDTTGGKIPDTEKTATFAYKFPLKAGRWVLFADKDVNGNGKFEEPGDYFGCFGQNGTSCGVFEPPKDGVNVQMKIVTGGTGTSIQLDLRDSGPRAVRPERWINPNLAFHNLISR
jgi:uncharacterized protein (DUF2141 family)